MALTPERQLYLMTNMMNEHALTVEESLEVWEEFNQMRSALRPRPSPDAVRQAVERLQKDAALLHKNATLALESGQGEQLAIVLAIVPEPLLKMVADIRLLCDAVTAPLPNELTRLRGVVEGLSHEFIGGSGGRFTCAESDPDHKPEWCVKCKLSAVPAETEKGANMKNLHLQGKCTDHIWLMEDGEAPHTIGLRMDCGDSGTVYLTTEQALYLARELLHFTITAPNGQRGEEKK